MTISTSNESTQLLIMIHVPKNNHYLSGSLDTIPDAEKHDAPGEDETERQVPLDFTQIVNAAWDVQHFVSVGINEKNTNIYIYI